MNISENCIFLNEDLLDLKNKKEEKDKIYNEAVELAKKEAIYISKKIQKDLLKELRKYKDSLEFKKLYTNNDELVYRYCKLEDKKDEEFFDDKIICLMYVSKLLDKMTDKEKSLYMKKNKTFFEKERIILSNYLDDTEFSSFIVREFDLDEINTENYIIIDCSARITEIYNNKKKEK